VFGLLSNCWHEWKMIFIYLSKFLDLISL
jgi:hypothetical protein